MWSMENLPETIERCRLLGGDVDLVTPAQVIDYIAACVTARRKAVIANHNFHSLYLQRRSRAMADFYAQADLIEADSTPMILWGKLMGAPISRRHRSTYLDWRERFWARACEKGWRVFFVGGAPGVADKGAQAVRGRWPGVELQTHHGYFDAAADSQDNALLRLRINAHRPDVVLVGMGMPRQEQWILENMEALQSGVLLSIGGAFDFEAGVTATPPRWLGRVGLEWAFRLVHEPRRLFTRYVVEPWFLVPSALGDLAGALTRRRRMTSRPLALPEHGLTRICGEPASAEDTDRSEQNPEARGVSAG